MFHFIKAIFVTILRPSRPFLDELICTMVNAIPERRKFTSPKFCVPFTQTMNPGLRNIKGRVSKCDHDSIHEVSQVHEHVRAHRMSFPSVKVTKVVGQEPNIHELLFLGNLVLRICPPGTAVYQESTFLTTA